MTRFIIFACLLAVQLNRGLSAEILTFTKAGTSTEVIIRDKGAEKCVLESNNGETYEYEPGLGFFDPHPKIRRSSEATCSVNILNTNMDDLGLWKITQYDKSGISKIYEFNLCFETYGTINPTSNMDIYTGHYALAKIANDLDDLVACYVTTPKKERFNILSEKKKDIEKFDICGVRIKVNRKFDGKWYLAAINKRNELVSGEFTLDVSDDESLITDQQNISLKLGSSAWIDLNNIKSSYCQLTDSHGVRLPLEIGTCKHFIDVVTPYHDGLWKARYGVKGRLNPIDIDIMVTTYDPEAVITNVNITADYDKVNMVCRLPVSENLRYCLFISPNGTMLHISPGIGIERYEFYREANRRTSCGITIHNPQNYDYGIWRCEVALENEKRYGSFLHLDSASSTSYAAEPSKNITAFGYDVSVKKNDNFTLKCTVNTVLHYCWFRSPNGTTYSVTTDKNLLSSNTLLYSGLGLQLGECGAIIDNAIYEHEGIWNCYMGVKSQSEIEATIMVDVADNYILAEKTTVVYNGKSNPSLSCHLLSNLNKNIDYCRWIRPDGRGIYGDTRYRYLSEMNDGSCNLIILGNGLQREDVGRWTCVAGLSGRTTEEVTATIDVNVPSMQIGTLAGIIIGACALLALVTGVLAVLNIRKRRLATTPPKNPPPYDAERVNGIPPKSMLHEQMRYDQKNWVD